MKYKTYIKKSLENYQVYKKSFNIVFLHINILGSCEFETLSQPLIDEEDIGTGSDSSCEWEIPDDPSSFTCRSPSNGYIQNSHKNTTKMPHSLTTNFDTKLTTKCNCSNNNSCNSSVICSSKCNTAVNSNNCINQNNESKNFINNFLRKSASVNSGLSRNLGNQQRNGFLSHFSPFSSNLHLSYFSSFNIFSSEK